MRIIKPDKHTKLLRLLTGMDPRMAAKLAAAIERNRLTMEVDLPNQSILDCLRPVLREVRIPRFATPLRIFCSPFEDLLVSTVPESKQRGRISRESILPVWNWLAEELIPDRHRELCEQIKCQILDGNDTAARDTAITLQSEAADAIIGLVDGLDPLDKPYGALARKLGGEVHLTDAREMATILRAAGPFLTLGERLPPRPINDLSENFVNDLKNIYDEFSGTVPDGAEYAVAMMLGRLAHPWQILRLARAFSWKSDDSLVSRTELAVVGELLLDDVDDIVQAAKQEIDGDQLIRQLQEFVALFDGITGEIGIRKDGDWGRRLLHARTALAAVIEHRLRTANKAFDLAMPKQRDSRGKPDPGKPLLDADPSDDAVAAAYAMADFMRRVRPLAKQAAVTKPLTEAFVTLENGIEIYSDRLTDALRRGPESETNRILAFLEIAATILERATDNEAASLIRRRSAAAVA